MATELKPCPHCGAPASGHAIEPHSHALVFAGVKMPDHPGSYVIEGDCACGSGLIGETEAEVTERWNRRAPASPSAPEWRPIETAPKLPVFRDGSHTYAEKILAWDGREVVRCRWWQHKDGAQNFIMDGGCACYPTHWQPLPAAPLPGKEAE